MGILPLLSSVHFFLNKLLAIPFFEDLPPPETGGKPSSHRHLTVQKPCVTKGGSVFWLQIRELKTVGLSSLHLA